MALTLLLIEYKLKITNMNRRTSIIVFGGLILTLASFDTSGQSQNTMIDPRDNQEYKTTNINGTIWMTENLNYETDLSLEPTDEEKSKHKLTGVRGRYYHFQERQSLCPDGWRLPNWNDWKNYIIHLTKDQGIIDLFYEEEKEPEHFHAVSGFSEIIDLFAENNPLSLRPIGRIQGQTLSTSPDTPFADYWTMDEHETTSGTSHVHLWEVLNVHSHQHHMDPKNSEELRRFMCRCIKE